MAHVAFNLHNKYSMQAIYSKSQLMQHCIEWCYSILSSRSGQKIEKVNVFTVESTELVSKSIHLHKFAAHFNQEFLL